MASLNGCSSGYVSQINPFMPKLLLVMAFQHSHSNPNKNRGSKGKSIQTVLQAPQDPTYPPLLQHTGQESRRALLPSVLTHLLSGPKPRPLLVLSHITVRTETQPLAAGYSPPLLTSLSPSPFPRSKPKLQKHSARAPHACPSDGYSDRITQVTPSRGDLGRSQGS